jgi:outer membrane receptor for ferrienterochelin and colicin
VDGQTNQFASNGLEGTSNVNLRGLGPARTLVLINGHRQTYSPFAVGEQAQLFVDTNMIPRAAIGRVEVLKDGAAALYGSDAIAGVVNFITRDDLQGLEVSGNYSMWDGNDDGDYDASHRLRHPGRRLELGHLGWISVSI